jgi:S-adenosylmethionine:tRNA ribosyltransferase-isomerase
MTDLGTPAARARTFTLSDFDFALPPERIAQHPAPERSASRLLDGRSLPPVDRIFRELPGLLRAGDLLVFNDTRVVKARIFGEKASGGKLELLIERVLTGQRGGGPHEGQQEAPARQHRAHGRRAPGRRL